MRKRIGIFSSKDFDSKESKIAMINYLKEKLDEPYAKRTVCIAWTTGKIKILELAPNLNAFLDFAESFEDCEFWIDSAKELWGKAVTKENTYTMLIRFKKYSQISRKTIEELEDKDNAHWSDVDRISYRVGPKIIKKLGLETLKEK